MDLLTLKKELLENKVRDFYCFAGVEREVINIYVKKIVEISGKAQKNTDKLSDVFGLLSSSNLFNTTNVYVVTNDNDFFKKESAWQKVTDKEYLKNNIIIMIYFSVDKRSRFYNLNSNYIFEFDKMSSEVLARQIKKEIGLSFSYAEDLAVRCDCLYGVVLLECDKLKIYSEILKMPIDETYKKAINEKLIFTNPSDVIFEFIESLCKKDIKRTFDLFADIKFTIESPLQVITLIYNNFRNILLVQSSSTSDNIASVTGLSDWLINKTKPLTGRYTIEELITNLKLLQWIEQGIKTGKIEADISLEYFLVRVL